MKIFDTHAHLNFVDYEKDREEVVERAFKEGVSMINVGTDIIESEKVVEIAKTKENGLYAGIGLHPLYVGKESFRKDDYVSLFNVDREKVVAIGETGLDKKGEKREKQRDVFKEHIIIAQELDLPLIVHCRMAHREVIEILRKEKVKKGVIHCFTGSLKEAKEYLSLNFYLGLNGILFKMDLNEIVKEIPLERIVLETDCPFLTPPPKKGRNEPSYIKEIVKKVASIKNISQGEVEEKTTENAINLFNIKQ